MNSTNPAHGAQQSQGAQRSESAQQSQSRQLPQSALDSAEAIARDIAAVGQLQAVPTLLEVLCESTGMRFAAVARVGENTWAACAVRNDVNLGLKPGDRLDLETTLCIESKTSNAPIVIEQASTDPRYRNHPMPKLYKIESYVSVPIVLSSGRYFGNLCAMDPAPARLADPKILKMFARFAALIGMQLDMELARQDDQPAARGSHAAHELREQFIAVLGHDLRNPLQAVYSAGVLLEKKVTDPALKSVAARIQISVKRMSSLLNDVLDFARASLGEGMAVRIAEVEDIDAGLTAVVKELQDAQPGRQIIADISVARKVPCDLGRVQQAVSNLIGNALKHGAPDGPVKVCARAEAADLVISVWNGGRPIAPENLDKIWEPFWRQSSSGGMGLGLYICLEIVRAHGGSLSVTSSEEGGTRFTARLPLAGKVFTGED